jgi:hypothetical protein
MIEEILERFQEISDDPDKQDGWDAFVELWEFVKSLQAEETPA